MPNEQLVIYYRISDSGYPKAKPRYITNEKCLKSAINCFPPNELNHWVVIADNCSDETIEIIKKYIPEQQIERTSVGHGAGTFLITLEKALSLPDNTGVYFLENDYLHRRGSRKALIDGLSIADYVSLYDHPNKYKEHFTTDKGGEKTRVILGRICHWKETHSTTMSFAAKAQTVKENVNIFRRWLTTAHPYDCEIFIDLARKGRRLISPIPGFSTHGETEFLGPFVDWEEVEKVI